MTETSPPADWYPDPSAPQQLRYWDGTAWTTHVAPVPSASPGVPQQGGAVVTSTRKGLHPAVIALIVVAALVGILSLLAAIAIPAFLTQRERASDAAVRADAMGLATEISGYLINSPDSTGLDIVQVEGRYLLKDGEHSYTLASASEGVTLGDFTMDSTTHWCLWLETEDGHAVAYDSDTGLADGRCAARG
ncbi:DUF2510 domain-containing protein [Demequina zhanjiangensis]|uniref:DUF2510 domain-containing protein n=1 Tax=Demequina zhanjiangensis TaxID=3051659 RepID=A0ABT8G303_9MICO|nr:DUF2510 domain-containing protein [Demequina sp. SYSU T00b26]MDN4473518.1 DUF2510 domain-containing protein [Demequina sp. SYSU T00b26]